MAGVVEPNGNGHPKSLLSSDLAPWSWRDAALCKGKDPEPWFPRPGEHVSGEGGEGGVLQVPGHRPMPRRSTSAAGERRLRSVAGTTPGQRARMRKLKSANLVAG